MKAFLSRIKPLSIFAGLATVIALNMAAAYLIPMVIGQEKIRSLPPEYFFSDTGFLLSTSAAGFFCIFIGGAVTAWLAREEALLNGILTGVVVIVIAVFVVPLTAYPLWYNAASFLLTIPFSAAPALVLPHLKQT